MVAIRLWAIAGSLLVSRGDADTNVLNGSREPRVVVGRGDFAVGVTRAFASPLPERYSSYLDNEVPEGGIGRIRWAYGEGQLGPLKALPEPGVAVQTVADETGFDLWNVARTSSAPPGADILLRFSIDSPSDRGAVIAFGCTGTCYLAVRGKIVFAAGGMKELVRTQTLVPIHLLAGENTVEVLCHRPTPWIAAPESHIRDQWMLALQLFGSAESAWSACRERNFHLLDTPIVERYSDLQVESVAVGHETATLYDLDGNVVAHGTIDGSGRTSWTSKLPHAPFCGFYGVGGNDAEAVIVTSSQTIDAVCEGSLRTMKHSDDARKTPWIERVHHLLNPEFRSSRDFWWARKLALSLCMSVVDRGHPQAERLLEKFKPSQIRFESYRSKIDGTRQYFRIFCPDSNLSDARPIVVLLPPVVTHVQSYLNNPEVANQRNVEDTCSVAQKYNVCLVWPGIVEVDYGGDLARTELDECLEKVLSLLNANERQVYVYGYCSSGVAAIGYAETRSIGGVILRTPVIGRWTHRWFSGVPVDNIRFPPEVLEAEQTVGLVDRLAALPVMLMYDSDVPGHGDLEGSKRLCERLVALGGKVEQDWPTLKHDFVWGESGRVALDKIFRWVKRTSASNTRNPPPPRRNRHGDPALTIKAALLNGFTTRLPADEALSVWMQNWGALWCVFRGSRWSLESSDRKSHTIVVGKVLDDDDLRAIDSGTFFRGNPVLELDGLVSVPAKRALFGFRAIPGSTTSTVEVFRSEQSTSSLPRLDLLVDGCCAGALWERRGGDWYLVNVWL